MVAVAAMAVTALAVAATAAFGVAGTTKKAGRTAAPASVGPGYALAHHGGGPRAPVRSCESLASLSLTNVTINSAVLDPGNATTPRSCRVNATSTHPPIGDRVTIDIWLPVDNYNGRFQGTGGGGFSGGGPGSLPAPIRDGYAAGATDTGHVGGSGSFALDANGRFAWVLMRDNAYLGIHEMTVVGKALTAAYYGKTPRYSYFNGCSTGGRQGLSEAQRYPADYDGILAGAPAINWQKLHVAQLWGQIAMNAAGNFVAPCKLVAATTAAVAACDTIDGVSDGVIEDPLRCKFDPATLVGTATACGEITAADAEMIRKIWQGPRRQNGEFMWYGLPRGANLTALNNSIGTPLTGFPFFITIEWFRYWLSQNPALDWRTITPEAYELYWDQSLEEFGALIGTDNPDLSAFRKRGGKIVMWHGWADQLIYPQGTIDYYERVQDELGHSSTSKFLRLFMAPGVAHCGGGAGPPPSGQFEALVRWVEKGDAPDTLDAIRTDANGTVIRSRPLCPYPLVARYKGRGSTDDADNFRCSKHF
ncbi:MAG TPA: tannase/feruloyl esterase family alpha/beta hydrolase [Gaiellaceae bacterium]